LGAGFEPVIYTVKRDSQGLFSTAGHGVIKPHTLNKFTVAAGARIGHNHIVKGATLRAAACESNDDHVVSLKFETSTAPGDTTGQADQKKQNYQEPLGHPSGDAGE
jgi:hypothetical protein